MSITLDTLHAQRGIDLDKLKVRFPALHKIVVRLTGKTIGIQALDLSRFQEASHKYFLECSAPLPDIAVPKPVGPAQPQISMDETLRENEKDIERRVAEAQARARLDEYVKIGLVDSQANANLFRAELDRLGETLSVATVDRIVKELGNRLEWRPKEKPEVLGKLPDGTTQLPLDVDNRTLSRASKEQARDWLKRANAGKIIRPSGSFIVNF
jgi:hypothetical protein